KISQALVPRIPSHTRKKTAKIIPERKSNRVPQTLAAAGLPYPCRRRTPSSSPPSRQRPASTPRGRSIETHGRGRHRASPRSASEARARSRASGRSRRSWSW
uniref:Uncharacterized protein n=1 Tax=Aegilops tauschii subsp. strangulata TaxID=200361 RepID=A0A453CLJ2_AEGTS